MSTSHRFRGAVILIAGLAALPLGAADGVDGGLVGWVENTHGAPVAGAVVSIFGKGLRGGSLITLSDSKGQFVLPALPAGSYTLRALGTGHLPAPPRRITVLPDRDATFTLNLTPLGETPGRLENPPAFEERIEAREARWLLRHKRRSVLEDRGDDPATAPEAVYVPSLLLASTLPDLMGTVEVMADTAVLRTEGERFLADAGPTSGALRLKGRLADIGRWSLGGVLSEAEGGSWRMAAEFVLEPVGGAHRIQTGGGYGSRSLRAPLPGEDVNRPEGRGTGALFVQDQWRLGPRVSASFGARYSYIGFLNARNHLDPLATIEYHHRQLSVRGTLTARTLAPGGDLLTLSTLATAPSLSFARMDADLRPERMLRYELAVDRSIGTTTFGARAFQEDVRDGLVNLFDDPNFVRAHRILNNGPSLARGMGLTVGRRFGDVVNGSVTYTYGRSWREDPASLSEVALSFRQADFHDVVARVETFIEGTDTRVVAFCRFNSLNPEVDGPGGHAALTNTRFDIQLSQRLPFLQSLTRADWELLLGVRNLFYEPSDGATLDEIAVVNPPKRVLGGVSIRF